MNRLSDVLRKTDRIFREYVMENATHNETWSLDPEEYFRELMLFFRDCEASG
jgi:hypothetical protein